jgi:catechol 2,3-dioxygenase-like lactoylglutathione lyase family enzyme
MCQQLQRTFALGASGPPRFSPENHEAWSVNHHVSTPKKKETTMSGPLSNAHTVTKLPAQDLERARAFYRDKLGLEPVEERTGGLRYVCGPTEFHLFSSAGASSGTATQMAFEVENLEATLAELRARGVTFKRFEGRGDTIAAPDNYPSKGTGELGTFFYDSEGNLIGIAQPVREGVRRG